VADDYDASSIQVLEGLESVRKVPGMYLGDPHDGSALHHCIWEVVDNAVDEHLAGYNPTVEVDLNPDGSVTVTDYGRGIPVSKHEEGVSAAEVIMTKLHAGGKFDSESYKVSGGLHGVGVSAVNAVSESLIMVIHREGKEWSQTYKKGVPQSKLKSVGSSDRTGTIISFKPDLDEVFSDKTEFDFERINTRMKRTAFLNAGLEIIVRDLRADESIEIVHKYDGGLREYVEAMNKNKEVVHEDVLHVIGSKEGDKGDVQVEVALQWTDAYSESINCFTNIIHNTDGGTHLSGLKSSLTRTVNGYAQKKKLLKHQGVVW